MSNSIFSFVFFIINWIETL